MTISPATIWGPVQLGTGATLLGSAVPANGTQLIKKAVFTNTDTVPVTITVYVVRSGQSPGVSNEVIAGLALSAGQAYPSPELSGTVLLGGDGVYALASIAAQVNTIASGFSQ